MKTDIIIIAIVPSITGNKINSKETSVNKTTKGFDAAGFREAIKSANSVFARVKNPFDEQRQQLSQSFILAGFFDYNTTCLSF